MSNLLSGCCILKISDPTASFSSALSPKKPTRRQQAMGVTHQEASGRDRCDELRGGNP